MYLTIYIRKLKQSESVWMSWHHVFCVTSRLFQNFAHFAPCPRDPNKVNPETRALLQPWLGSKLRRMTRRTGHLARLWVEQSMYFFKWNHSPREFMLHIWKPEVSTTYIYIDIWLYIYAYSLRYHFAMALFEDRLPQMFMVCQRVSSFSPFGPPCIVGIIPLYPTMDPAKWFGIYPLYS